MAARTARRVDHNAAAGAIARLTGAAASPRPHAARIVGLLVEAQRRLKALDGDGQATAIVVPGSR